MKNTLKTVLIVAPMLLVCHTTFAQQPRFLEGLSANDGAKVMQVLKEIQNADLAGLPSLPIKQYQLPEAGIDVMRVRMDETYRVAGVGTDTIQLSGWIAVLHDNPRPAPGEKRISWGTAVSDTEFVGMDLRADSKVFGPVRVTLNPDVRSRGIVGKLEFSIMDSIMLDMAYAEHRGTRVTDLKPPSQPAVAGQSPRPFGFQFQPPPKLSKDQQAVSKTVNALLASISEKNAEKMLSFYDKSPSNVFFNTNAGMEIRGAEPYVKALAKMFANLRTIKVVPDNNMQVRVSGSLATVNLTGINDVVDNEGRRGTGPWELTMTLQKSGSQWRVTHDHLSFRDLQALPNKALLPNQIPISAAAAKCMANIDAKISMNRLNLDLLAARPIQWYSEVDTIPPVGQTASVSLFPTPLLSGTREVASLQHGAVRFREVVLHVPLEGHQPASAVIQ